MITYGKPINPQQTKPVSFIPDAVQKTLGQGLAVPLSVVNNKWATLNGVSKVQQNIFMTIMTPVGVSLGQPDFGSLIPHMLFERMTPILQAQMVDTVKTSLAKWLPIITVVGVTLDLTFFSHNKISLFVYYEIKSTGIRNVFTILFTTPDNQQFPPGVFVVNTTALFGGD